ncbi:hypothetical protein AF335_06215 [Streptomyces eurocidicus]|uniref:Uncharacterized protein n=1 Tax=Streptomyces eurocidicus TaxID=66423 RepID=A0A2N8NZP5_STREU|nr:hypothetical protein AF335_06215 [Streptomyces eurocidicus]
MDDIGLWALIEEPGGRLELATRGEGRAVVVLLRKLAEQGGPRAEVAADLAARIGRRLPAEG